MNSKMEFSFYPFRKITQKNRIIFPQADKKYLPSKEEDIDEKIVIDNKEDFSYVNLDDSKKYSINNIRELSKKLGIKDYTTMKKKDMIKYITLKLSN